MKNKVKKSKNPLGQQSFYDFKILYMYYSVGWFNLVDFY